MNKKQKIILWVSVIVIVLIGIFPPWIYVCARRTPVPITPEFIYTKNAGYHFLWTPPSHLVPKNRLAVLDEPNAEVEYRRLVIDGLRVSEIRLNTPRLLAEYVIALPILGLLFAFMLNTKHH